MENNYEKPQSEIWTQEPPEYEGVLITRPQLLCLRYEESIFLNKVESYRPSVTNTRIFQISCF
jgi:hypothetical protein